MHVKQTLYYLSGFNNYYNRQIKKPLYRNISDFEEWVVLTTEPMSFNPNDGVATQVVVNYGDLDDRLELDYVLVSEDNNTIDSKWWVVERVRNLAGQWVATLRRDLISDYYPEIMGSPVYIERAMLKYGSKLLFNSEGSSFNQIKTREHLLKDETGCGWVVGYLAASDIGSKTISVSTSDISYPTGAYTYEQLTAFRDNAPWQATDGWAYKFNTRISGSWGAGKQALLTIGKNSSSHSIYEGSTSYDILVNGGSSEAASRDAVASITSELSGWVSDRQSEVESAMYGFMESKFTGTRLSESGAKDLVNMSGGAYSDGTNIYTVQVSVSSGSKNNFSALGSSAGAVYSLADQMLNAFEGSYPGDTYYPYYPSSVSGVGVEVERTVYTVSVSKVSSGTATCTITNSARVLSDAPYRMFAIPYGEVVSRFLLNTTSFTTTKDVALNIAKALPGVLGQDNVYDIQLLPYCPVRRFITDNLSGERILISGVKDVDYTLIQAADSTISYMLWADVSNFQFYIYHTINVPRDAINFKVANETEFCRLCSPNYNGTFEFKPTQNYGVHIFEVNATYKPFQPYIHVNPYFNTDGLFGGDFNDQRGLVCSGDFSLPLVNNKWTDYQIQNKSYADAHARQIENMSNTYNLNRQREVISGSIGIATAGLTGATSGGMIGKAFGAGGAATAGIAAGSGVVSALASAWGLQQDLRISDALYTESKSYAEDMYKYNLQNIQALPYSLGRVSAFTINNKIFPFIEYYSATEEEKTALRSRIEYYGMTVGVVDLPANYGSGWIQGELVRLHADNVGTHEALELGVEFRKGVYI